MKKEQRGSKSSSSYVNLTHQFRRLAARRNRLNNTANVASCGQVPTLSEIVKVRPRVLGCE